MCELSSALIEELETDEEMMKLVDRYAPEAIAEQQRREETCGIDPQRLRLYNLGVVALTGKESDLLFAAHHPSASRPELA